jgi:hypothetical protein
MSSTITLSILTEHGELLTKQQLTVDYGDERQDVTIILDDPKMAALPIFSPRDALNDCMAQQLAMIEGDDA